MKGLVILLKKALEFSPLPCKDRATKWSSKSQEKGHNQNWNMTVPWPSEAWGKAKQTKQTNEKTAAETTQFMIFYYDFLITLL